MIRKGFWGYSTYTIDKPGILNRIPNFSGFCILVGREPQASTIETGSGLF